MKFKSNIIKEIIGLGINEIEQVSREEALGYIAKIRIASIEHHHFKYAYRGFINNILKTESGVFISMAQDIEHDIRLLMTKTYEKEPNDK